MFITRIINGTEIKIELTDTELMLAYCQKEADLRTEDLFHYYQDNPEVIAKLNANPEMVDDILDLFDICLSRHDGYWDCYWGALDYSVKETLKEKGIDLL